MLLTPASYSRFVVITFALLGTFAVSSARAQQASRDGAGTHGKKVIRAVRTELPIVMDGNLDEPAWQEASIALGFLQKEPQEGENSTEKTEFRVLYTATTMYIGVICYDSNPQRVLGTERRRDNQLENDDTISLVLDTFHDHRNSYLFRTNPLGAQYDALITDEGNNVNANWDERWDVVSRITKSGWTAEFAIPFKSLRVREEEDGQIWGLDVERVIRRKNEFTYWNGYRRGFNFESVSQAGHLTGLEAIESGLRLRIKPYLLGGFTQAVRRESATSEQFRSVIQDASDYGLEVIKYRITPSLTADLTWETDFAQTEVDDQQVNLDRFPLFFPEKREFFQEGAGIYEFGVATGENPNELLMKLFHSRQIGLSPLKQPVPIIGGARVTGKLQGFTLGLMNVQTEAYPAENIRASNYGVLRVKRDVLSRSSVGGFLLSREQGGTSDYNRVYGADANFVFLRHLVVGGLLAKSSSPGIKGDNWISAGVVRWDSDLINLETSWAVVDPKFRDDLGFVPRKNMRQIAPQIGFKPRPNTRLIRQLMFRARSDYTMNQENELETRLNHYTLEIRFQDGGVFGWSPHTVRDTLKAPFQIRSGIVIPTGIYNWWYNVLRYRSNPAKRLAVSFFSRQNFGYWNDASLVTLSIDPRLRISEQFSLEVGYSINKASFPQQTCAGSNPVSYCGFTDHTVNTRINYNFSNQWLTSTIIQYNKTDNFLGFNFRLNYIFRPGDDFFLIYNDGRRVGGLLDGQKERTLQTKLTYSFDF